MRHALASLDASLDALRAAGDCEVFVRRTRRLRIAIEQGHARVQRGTEEGTAVRVRAPDGGLRFGAASGAGVTAAMRAHAEASSLPATPRREHGPPWAAEGRMIEVEGQVELPTLAEAEAWLREAAGGLRAGFDAAVAVEALGSVSGLRACRVRGIVWARVLEGTRVRSAVARRLETLDPLDLNEPSVPSERFPGRLPALGSAVVLLPAAAGSVAPILASSVAPGSRAGPGWVCVDDPADPNAPSGGRFDDTGFPADRLVLAEAGLVLAVPRGPGRRRRLSFRHPPEERAANLQFRPAGEWDGCGLMARAARVHVADGSWWTELDAAPALDGVPVAPWAPWVVQARPEAWIAGCRASVGPSRRTPEGVASGTLVFEGLTASMLGA